MTVKAAGLRLLHAGDGEGLARRTVLVTGAAGFIGDALTQRLLQQDDRIVDVEILDSYYNPALKKASLRQIETVAKEGHWRFETVALEDGEAVIQLFSAEQPKVVGAFGRPSWGAVCI
jgi:UDP-glucuronate 4-epimerase